MLRNNRFYAFHGLILAVCLLTGCGKPALTPEQDETAARDLFNSTVAQYHLPSAEASGTARAQLLDHAAAGYEKVIQEHPAQTVWCAQALRSLGNVRAAQGRIEEAVKLYRSVPQRYPTREWEGLQALKAAGDTLWDAGREAEAREFYQVITQRFDRADSPLIFQTVVRGACSRLAESTH